jgi:hypothetical protein
MESGCDASIDPRDLDPNTVHPGLHGYGVDHGTAKIPRDPGLHDTDLSTLTPSLGGFPRMTSFRGTPNPDILGSTPRSDHPPEVGVILWTPPRRGPDQVLIRSGHGPNSSWEECPKGGYRIRAWEPRFRVSFQGDPEVPDPDPDQILVRSGPTPPDHDTLLVTTG